MIVQTMQLVGALIVLLAFFLNDRGVLTPSRVEYAGLNLVGSGLLSGVALVGGQWGFLLLNTIWFLVAARRLVRGPG